MNNQSKFKDITARGAANFGLSGVRIEGAVAPSFWTASLSVIVSCRYVVRVPRSRRLLFWHPAQRESVRGQLPEFQWRHADLLNP